MLCYSVTRIPVSCTTNLKSLALLLCCHAVRYFCTITRCHPLVSVAACRGGLQICAVNFSWFEIEKISFTFDGMVNAADKYPGNVKTYCAQHQEECVAQASIITKEEEQLKWTIHIGFFVIVDGISKHKDGSWAPTQYRSASNKHFKWSLKFMHVYTIIF